MLNMDYKRFDESGLRNELEEAHREIRTQDREIVRLNQIRRDLEQEIEELSAKLFEEAYRMVNEAQSKQMQAEKFANEQTLKVEVLSAEVEALKLMVLTSTPSQPNFHLHPQIQQQQQQQSQQTNCSTVKKSHFFPFHRRSPSHCNLLYGRRTVDVIDGDRPLSKDNVEPTATSCSLDIETLRNQNESEFDPFLYNEFLVWIEKPKTISLQLPLNDLQTKSTFLNRIYCDDVYPCLRFADEFLNGKIRQAIENGTIFIEPIVAEQLTHQSLLRVCSLLKIPSVCPYRMKIDGNDPWCDISLFARNRITAVCDLINFLKYIERGLVKCSNNDIYRQILKFRLEINKARLS